MSDGKTKQFPAAERLTIKSHIFVFFLLVILTFSVYANSLEGDFFWDDIGLIKDNYLIKNFNYLPQLFVQPLSKTFHYCYRPLLNLSFMIDYSLWQINSLGYHITAISIHILNSFLVYLLIYLLSKNFRLAVSTGLIFSVHSVLSEPVNYLSSRADLLIGLFCLSAFVLYILYRTSAPKKKIYLIGSLFLFISGLLSKEMAIVLILILILYELILSPGKENIKQKLFSLLPYLIALAIFVLIRSVVLKANVPDYVEPFAISELSLWQRFFTTITAIPTYLRLLLVPIGLHKEWLMQPIESIVNFNVIYSLALIVMALLLAKFIYSYSKICTFGILWFFVLLIPVLNIFPLNSFMSEGWLYLPSIGFFLFIIALILRITQQKAVFNRSVLLFLLIIVLSFYSFLTIKRNKVWANERQVFFTEMSEFNPYSSRAYTNLGLIYVEQNKLNEAIDAFIKALEIEPDNPGLHRNMGNVYSRLKRLDMAKKAYEKALSINPNDAETLGNLGNLHSDQNDLVEAVKYFKRAIEIDPHSANFHNSLGTAYFKQNNLDGAVNEYKKAIEISPDNAKAHANLGIIYYHQKLLEESISQFNKAVRLDPAYIDAYYNLGVIYFRLGQLEKAEANLKMTLSLASQQNKSKLAQNTQYLLEQLPQ